MNKFKTVHYVTVNNSKYEYSFSKPSKNGIVFFECKAAKIAQEFLAEDIPALLVDLPELIIEEKDYENRQKDTIRFRVSTKDKKLIEKKAAQKGYDSVSSYLRDVALND